MFGKQKLADQCQSPEAKSCPILFRNMHNISLSEAKPMTYCKINNVNCIRQGMLCTVEYICFEKPKK